MAREWVSPKRRNTRAWALLHDIGKIGSDELIQKKGQLTDLDAKSSNRTPDGEKKILGGRIPCARADYPALHQRNTKGAATLTSQGQGYPAGARIFAHRECGRITKRRPYPGGTTRYGKGRPPPTWRAQKGRYSTPSVRSS